MSVVKFVTANGFVVVPRDEVRAVSIPEGRPGTVALVIHTTNINHTIRVVGDPDLGGAALLGSLLSNDDKIGEKFARLMMASLDPHAPDADTVWTQLKDGTWTSEDRR